MHLFELLNVNVFQLLLVANLRQHALLAHIDVNVSECTAALERRMVSVTNPCLVRAGRLLAGEPQNLLPPLSDTSTSSSTRLVLDLLLRCGVVLATTEPRLVFTH